jgi:hypothetical protein
MSLQTHVCSGEQSATKNVAGDRVSSGSASASHLRNVSSVYIPADGKYAIGGGKKPKKDWNLYADAWHWLGSGTRRVL